MCTCTSHREYISHVTGFLCAHCPTMDVSYVIDIFACALSHGEYISHVMDF